VPTIVSRKEATQLEWAPDQKSENLENVNEIWSLAFSADGKTLVSGENDKTALVWDISAAYRALEQPPSG